MSKKDELKIFTVKNIMLTVGAIVLSIALASLIRKPKEAKPAKLNFPKDWQQ